MPQTAVLFLVGILALSGIPPFNGFFSKDWIIAETFSFGNLFLFGLTFISAVLSVVYGFRLWFVIFTGKPSKYSEKAKESYPIMLFPLYVLATLTILTAFYKEDIVHFLFGNVHEPFYANLFVATMVVMFTLFSITYLIYFKKAVSTQKFLSHPLGESVNTFLYKGWMVDDGIKWVCRNIFYGSIAKAVEWIDTKIVDGAVNGTVTLSLWCWDRFRKIQTGDLINYLTYFAIGVVVLSFIILAI